jgi:hypothetical protein
LKESSTAQEAQAKLNSTPPKPPGQSSIDAWNEIQSRSAGTPRIETPVPTSVPAADDWYSQEMLGAATTGSSGTTTAAVGNICGSCGRNNPAEESYCENCGNML